MLKNIFYTLIILVNLIIIVLNFIGFRGVYYDLALTEIEKNKFLFEYGTTTMIALLFFTILICLRNKF